MKNSYLALFLLGFGLLFLTSCKSEFEKIRASGDTGHIYEEANKHFDAGEYFKAQTLYELIIGAYRGKKEQEQIYFRYAYCHYYQKKYMLASYYFKNFANTYANSAMREEADYMSSYSNYQLSPTYRLDQTHTLKAMEGMQLFVNTYPTSERVAECNQLMDIMRKKLERKAYNQAELYYNLQQYQSATQAFENILQDYPETSDAELIRFMMVKSSYDLADNSVDLKKEERFNTTMEYHRIFKEKYPESQYSKELASILKNSKKQLKEIKDVRYQIESSKP